MNHPASNPETYGGELARWTASFNRAAYQDFEGELEETCTTDDVRRFLVNSFGNRYAYLLREHAALAGAFEDIEALLQAYIRAVGVGVFDVQGPADEECFLIWLAETQPLTDVQRDFVTCQRGEYAVATEGRRLRPAHIAFQELRKRTQTGSDDRRRLHLNPIRFAAELLTSAVVPGLQSLPARVLFYPDRSSVASVLLDEPTARVIDDLAIRSPCNMEEWLASAEPERRAELARLIEELAAQGLVAFESA